jgi:hypothetical protein
VLHDLGWAGPHRIAPQGPEPHLTQKGQPELIPTDLCDQSPGAAPRRPLRERVKQRFPRGHCHRIQGGGHGGPEQHAHLLAVSPVAQLKEAGTLVIGQRPHRDQIREEQRSRGCFHWSEAAYPCRPFVEIETFMEDG